jgi:hypothetical protein
MSSKPVAGGGAWRAVVGTVAAGSPAGNQPSGPPVGLWELVLAAGSLDRRCVSRSAAFADDAEGDRSGDFGALAAGAGSEVAVLEPVGVALEAHEGNATLNYRSVLARELTVEDAELYRRPGHRRRLRRVSAASEGLESV